MTEKINAQSLFTNSTVGLQQIFMLANSNTKTGLTQDELDNYTSKYPYYNSTFAQFIETNFSNLDKDGNSEISGTEMTQLMRQIQNQGLSYQDLISMTSSSNYSSGLSQSLVSTVLEHFSEIDTNHDGRVSSSEINNYNSTKEIEDKHKEYSNRMATDISVFYDDAIIDTDTDIDSDSDSTDV